MTELVLFLPYPPSANNLYPGIKRRRRSVEYDEWIAVAGLALKPQLYRRRLPLDPPYHVTYEYRRPNNARRDLGNVEKAVSDQLVKSGVLVDDCKIDEMTLRWVKGVPWEVRATIRSVP